MTTRMLGFIYTFFIFPFIRIRIIRVIRGRYPRALVVAEVDGVACHGGGVVGCCRRHHEMGAAGAQRPRILRVAQGVVAAQHDNLVDIVDGDAEWRIGAYELAVVTNGVGADVLHGDYFESILLMNSAGVSTSMALAL